MLRSFVGKIRKGFSLFVTRRTTISYFREDQLEAATVVPDDVKEGHFTVLAIMGEETKRFIVKLEYLTDPAFMGLLDRAGEEYGFRQQGALAVPCLPQELQKILETVRDKSTKVKGRSTSHIPIINFKHFKFLVI